MRVDHGLAGVAIDPHHLLLRRMNAAGEDARLDRRAIAAGPHQAGARHRTRQHLEQPIARLVASGERHQPHRSAETGDVVRGIAGAARHDLRGVVLEDQHRRFARHARDAAINEFVGNQITEDDNALTAERRNQREQRLCDVSHYEGLPTPRE